MIKRLLKADIDDLYPFQKEAIDSFMKGKDVFVKAPTGTGKTLIPLICSTFVLGKKLRCVFLVPTRRLIDQTYDKLRVWFAEDCQIVKITGEDRPSHTKIKKADIIVTTYESFNGLLAKNYETAPY